MKPLTKGTVPPLPRLRVRNQVAKQQANPCLVIMTQMLNCWASNGEGAATCGDLELQLKQCMNKAGKIPPPPKPTLNYHASRLLPKIHKKK
ncbi:DEKNAAC104253 [Brettanomyces naardenensis]|uniref:DEKNAAC104253 n=1 Tax=Brettanomyces naardenensis TaxID=13370 RepID=A0A448YPW6_BRENA|nr:DEKNAAC104253 [Brettanomyces naardenensis]